MIHYVGNGGKQKVYLQQLVPVPNRGDAPERKLGC
jgi:hypothetical protein